MLEELTQEQLTSRVLRVKFCRVMVNERNHILKSSRDTSGRVKCVFVSSNKEFMVENSVRKFNPFTEGLLFCLYKIYTYVRTSSAELNRFPQEVISLEGQTDEKRRPEAQGH